MRTAHGRPATGHRRGTVLIVTMILVFALAGITLVLCRSMRVEMIASANYAAGLKASAVERGAEQYLMAMLAEDSTDLNSIPENYFEAMQIGDGYFWVLRPDYGDSTLPLFGMVDETSKLNINVATYDQLMLLPCMTDDVAAAIIDWRDADSDVTNGGAEDEYYLSLPDPYYTKNANFETVEELTLVRGIYPELLYGTGNAPPLGSPDLLSTFGSGSGSSMLDDVWLERGIFELLTIWGTEPTTAADGTQRVTISSTGQDAQLLQLLQTQLGQQRANQIALALGRTQPSDIFDLYFRGKLTETELDEIADYVTSSAPTSTTTGTTARTGQTGQSSQNRQGTQAAQGAQSAQSAQGGQGQTGASTTAAQPSGKINVNFAPREVLMTLPNLESADVDKLISARQGLSDTELSSIAWVATALGQKAVGLGSLITARSNQHSALILAASGDGRSFKLVRVVIDTTTATTPQIVYRRDLTERGWPMDTQVLESLRAGQGPGIRVSGGSLSTGGLAR